MTNESEFGSFPSPERNIDPDNFISQDPTSGISGLTEQVITDSSFYNQSKLIQTVRRDLMNIDNFKLSSGDKFAVYIVDRNAATNLLNNIGKIFDFKVANINDGSISYLENFDLFDKSEISFDESISGKPIKYNVYNESTIGKLAIIVKLKTIDYFNFNVRETTDVKNITKKTVLINAKSGTSCDIKCKGFKLNVYKPNSGLVYTTYIYSETGNIDDVYFQLTGFDEDVEYLFEAIPYTQFQLYDSEEFIQFIKKQSIVIGKDNSGVPSGEDYYTDLYKYYSGEDYVMIDFNIKMRTSGQIQKAYIELYDTHADVSTIKEISNFSLYGQNTIRIEALTEEIKDDDFGGINPSNVGIYTESSGIQVLLSKDKRYRKDGMIRLNHFYIVRICLVEVNQNTDGTSKTDYHDLYKTIITDTLLNSKYNDSDVINYDVLKRTLNDPIYKKNESFSTTESGITGTYLDDFTVVNDQSLMYKIIDNASGKDKSTFGYRLSQSEKYLETISYDFNFNNSTIGKLNDNSIVISSYGLENPNFQKIQNPIFIGTKYKDILYSLRTTEFGYDDSLNHYKVDDNYLNPKIDLYLKSTSSRVAYGEADKGLKIKDGFRKIYMSNKLSSSVASKMADMEFGGIARWIGTGKYSGQSGRDTERSELLIRRGIHPAIHSDNFNIHLKVNTDLREGTWGTHWYDTTNGNGNSNGVVTGTNILGWPKWQSFIGKYINIKGAHPEEAYSTYGNGAITSMVNKQKYVYIFPEGDAGGPDGYLILPISATSIDDLVKKILKFTGSVFYATPSSGNYSIYYIKPEDYSYDSQFSTKFLFDSFGLKCKLNKVPAFKIRFKNSNVFSLLDLSAENVNAWVTANAVSTGRHIINKTFSNILSTPYFSEKEFELEKPKVEVNSNIIITTDVINKFASSKEDLERDPVWIDEKNIKSEEINTSLKQYEPILKYFKFDKTTESFYYSADFQWAYSSNCKYSYNGNGPSNNRRTIGMGISLSTANFDV